MALGLNSILNMGRGALFASQACINVTGNNIANVNTPGYSRQAVVLQENFSIDFIPGQVSQGVEATEIIRYFDKFIESAYLDKFGSAARYNTETSLLRTAETIFNESTTGGVSTAFTEFLKSWSTLAQEPDSSYAREALLGKANTFAASVRTADDSLRELEEQATTMIREDVDKANQLIQDIADLNKEINANYLKNKINPNELMDKRDSKVRELAAIIDVDVQDRGPNDYVVTTKAGYTLVQEDIPFSLLVQGPRSENHLMPSSAYSTDPAKSPVQFSGADNYEYTLEVVSPGDTAIGAGAKFRVSIDGGRSWLMDDTTGQPQEFEANEESDMVHVGELDVWFEGGTVTQGDKFVIAPKTDVYWVRPTSGPLNISTQIYQDGSENSLRITGGSLGGLLEFRDYQIGEYRDRLEAYSDAVTWEVNRIHSQGAGLQPLTSMLGSERVAAVNEALGDPNNKARCEWGDRLQEGNVTFSIYKKDGNGNYLSQIPYPGLEVFSGTNFDPKVNSLQDVADAINAASFVDNGGVTQTPFKATIFDGKLQITAGTDSTTGEQYAFAITADTTGLAAALGINTFFKGDTATTMAVNDTLQHNTQFINSGRVNGAGEINPGDNQTATEISELNSKQVDISSTWLKTTRQTLNNNFANLVTKVGSDTASVKFTAKVEVAMANELFDRQEEISGVNLDEEMSNLIKFQASYKAAAKLITTADEMIQTVLGLKQ